jgi:hypothetical protein
MKISGETVATIAHAAPMSELTSYHQTMVEKYKDLDPNEIQVTSGASLLMSFNGFYALGNAPGAFFAIDTNIYVNSTAKTQINDVALLISLDGTTSFRFPFTGTFDGTILKQKSNELGGLDVELAFVRTDGSNGIIASCLGTISMQGKPEVNISGTTYNNPIPISLFNGNYCVKLLDTTGGLSVIAMQIIDTKIMYDYGTNGANLQEVPSYCYNLNMYFFTFKKDTQSISLIMGTAAAGGFACNNMVIDDTTKAVTTRSFQTILYPKQATLVSPNLSSAALAAFSGYYQIPSVASPDAFISVQAQYVTLIGQLDAYVVMISVSTDGITSNGYYFEESNMSFVDNVLTMTLEDKSNITLTFNRQYNPNNGSLVSVSGNIGTLAVNGCTLFNPVPLSVFGGAVMSNAAGIKLTVVNDNEVVYAGTRITTTMNTILYVPLMYILAYPPTSTNTVMSFGTDGLKGNTCIITDNNSVYVVNAILD